MSRGRIPDTGGRHRILYPGRVTGDIDFTVNMEQDTTYRQMLEEKAED